MDRRNWVVTDVGVIQDMSSNHSEYLCFNILEKQKISEMCGHTMSKKNTQMGMSLESVGAKHNYHIAEFKQWRDRAQCHLFPITPIAVFMNFIKQSLSTGASCFALLGPVLHCIGSSSIQYILLFGVHAQVSSFFAENHCFLYKKRCRSGQSVHSCHFPQAWAPKVPNNRF